MSEQDAVDLTPAPEPEELVLDDDTPAPEDPEFDELEIGPKKFKVEKPIKEAWNGLQKTVQSEKESVKAEKEALAKERAALQESEKFRGALMGEVAKITAINEQLEPYLKLTPAEWVAWGEQDAAAAQKAQLAIGALQMQRDKLIESARAKGQALEEESRKAQAARLAAAERDLPAKIKDWSPAKKEALVKAAVENGWTPDEIEPISHDWRIMAALDKIAKYDQAVARAAHAREAAAKAAKEQQGEPEPVAKVKAQSGSTVANRLDDKVPSDQWFKNRQADLKRKGMRF